MRFLESIQAVWNDLDQKARLRSGYILIALLAAALGWSLLASKVAGLERKRNARENVLKELLPLKLAYRSAKQSSDMLTGRMASLRPDDSPARILEEIGIKGRGVKIAPLKGDERVGMVEDAADVRVEGLSLNEAVNLVYRLEKGSRPLVLKKCNLRVRFDDPSRCDLTMILALLKPVPGQAR
jgi:general secretion pathway protein M